MMKRTTVVGKADLFSRTYENLDQELKNACLKYENAQARKGLRVTRISIVYTPKEAPYFEIDVDEEVKIKGQRVKVVAPKKPCKHTTATCNGLGQLDCVQCDQTTGVCTDIKCPKCEGKDDEPVPTTLRSSRFPAVLEDDDEDDKSL
jgi:hypothetical protein